jgi:hypothetical protein
VRNKACKSAKLRLAELIPKTSRRSMPALQGAQRTSALVMAVAFPHHARQEKRASDVWTERPGEMLIQHGERCGGE